MSRAEFQVVFDGPALAQGEIDVRELSASLTSMGQLFEEANALLNGDQTRHQLKVKGSFKTGSFKIDLTSSQAFMDKAKTMLLGDEVASIVAAGDLVSYVLLGSAAAGGSLLGLLKWLRGRKPTKILEADDGSFEVYKGHDYVKVEEAVLKLYQDFKVRQAFEAALVKPLKPGEVETIAFTKDSGETFETVTYVDRQFYAAIEEESADLASHTYTTNVSLVRLSFKEDNKWAVTDGQNTFNVTVEDEQFTRQIQDNEVSFSKGDILEVRMRMDQEETSTGLKTAYAIEEVLEHRAPMFRGQLRLGGTVIVDESELPDEDG